jgi:hypothetical protein
LLSACWPEQEHAQLLLLLSSHSHSAAPTHDIIITSRDTRPKTAIVTMDQVHGVDVSWLHTPNKGKRMSSKTNIMPNPLCPEPSDKSSHANDL